MSDLAETEEPSDEKPERPEVLVKRTVQLSNDGDDMTKLTAKTRKEQET